MSYSISFEAKLMIHGESSTCTQLGCQGESIDPSMEEVLPAHKWIVFVRSSGDWYSLSYQDLQDKQVYHSRYGLRIAGGFVDVGGSSPWM